MSRGKRSRKPDFSGTTTKVDRARAANADRADRLEQALIETIERMSKSLADPDYRSICLIPDDGDEIQR